MPPQGDRHPDDDLRKIVAGVLGLPVRPESGLACFLLAAGRDPPAVLIAGNVRVCLFRLEIGRGGVDEEEEVHLKVEEVGDLVVRPLGEVGLDGQQVVHGPVAGIVGDVVQAVDVDVLADPPRPRAWRTRPAPGSRPVRTGPARWPGPPAAGRPAGRHRG